MTPAYFWYAINAFYADMIKAKSKDSPKFIRDAYTFLGGEYLDSDWLFTTANNILGYSIDKSVVESFIYYAKKAEKMDAQSAMDGFNLPSRPALYSFWLYRDASWIGTDGSLVVDHTALLYVGMTSDLERRMKQHHRMDEISFLLDCGFSVDFLYLAENDMVKFKSLQKAERDFIENFYPIMNGNIRGIGENPSYAFLDSVPERKLNLPCLP